MDDLSEPPSLEAQSFGHSFDPGSVEEPVRSDQETEVSVGKTHGDPSALLKRGVGHMDGPPSIAHRTTQGMGTQVGCLGIHDDHLDGNQSESEDDKNSDLDLAAQELLAAAPPPDETPYREPYPHRELEKIFHVDRVFADACLRSPFTSFVLRPSHRRW